MNAALVLIAALLFGVGACGGMESAEGSGASGSYSGSITLELEPLLVIPDADPAGGWLLDGFAGAKLLEDGRIVVPSDAELHVFEPDGTHAGVMGGRGRGLGEFGSIWGFARCDDGRWVVADWQERRLTEMPDSGGDVLTVPYPLSRVSPSLQVLGCSDRVLFANHTIDAAGSAPRPDGSKHDTLMLLAGDTSLEQFDTLALVPGSVNFRGLRMPYGSYALAAFSAGGLAYGHTGDSVIFTRPLGGDSTHQIVVNGLPRGAVSTAMRERQYAYLEEETPTSIWEREIKPILAELPWPRQLPLWDGLLVDELGGAWVREYRQPLDADTLQQVWHAVSASGEQKGTLVLDAREELLAVDGTRVMLTRRSEDDVEQLVVVEMRSEK